MKKFLCKFSIIKTLKHALFMLLIMVCLTQVMGCASNIKPTNSLQADLTVDLLYPIATTEVEMERSFKSIVKVLDNEGKVVEDAEVTLSLKDSEDRLIEAWT